jgi:hypothetical protein
MTGEPHTWEHAAFHPFFPEFCFPPYPSPLLCGSPCPQQADRPGLPDMRRIMIFERGHIAEKHALQIRCESCRNKLLISK